MGIGGGGVDVSSDVEELLTEIQHTTILFPEGSNEIVVFQAGTVNTFCPWVEIIDNNLVTLSSKFTSYDGHLSSINIETLSAVNKIYVLELAYGSAKTIISRSRFISSIAVLGFSSIEKIRSVKVPAGEKVYYRMKCETASATVECHFRYHLHS